MIIGPLENFNPQISSPTSLIPKAANPSFLITIMTENHGLTDKELRLIKSYNIVDLFGDWFLTKKQKAKIQEKADKINEQRRMKREKEISSSA